MRAEIVLDISRLLWRARHRAPTGIDRVEMAYAQHLLTGDREHAFAAITPLGLSGRLPAPAVREFLTAMQRCWSEPERRSSLRGLARRLWLHAALGRRGPAGPGRRAYLMLSHTHLQRADAVRRALAREQASLVCFVHDLIPVEYPEYARPGEADRHVRRMETVARCARLVLVNSEATRQALQSWFALHLASGGAAPRVGPPVLTAPLGVAHGLARVGTDASPEAHAIPYFVVVGTLEPRKNHLFVLQLWRRMADGGGATPRLVLVGRRGWENENLDDMLERCTRLRGIVTVCESTSDAGVRRLLAGARALLLPSFAEGYGLPLAEALAMGVPALCSDLPALREVGREVPEYFDPQDGPAWRAAVRDYAMPYSARRAAQLARLARWRAPAWADHFDAVMPVIDEVCQ